MFRILQQLAIIGALWLVFGGLVFWLHPQARGLFTGSQAAVPQGEGEISLAEAKLISADGKALWVDVRPIAEFNREHVPGAENVPADVSGALESKLFEWTRAGTLGADTTMIVYCASSGCGTSHQLRKQLLQLNPSLKVAVLAGGWAEWKRGESSR
jgi:rhodanese-related sulfurtransferase